MEVGLALFHYRPLGRGLISGKSRAVAVHHVDDITCVVDVGDGGDLTAEGCGRSAPGMYLIYGHNGETREWLGWGHAPGA